MQMILKIQRASECGALCERFFRLTLRVTVSEMPGGGASCNHGLTSGMYINEFCFF